MISLYTGDENLNSSDKTIEENAKFSPIEIASLLSQSQETIQQDQRDESCPENKCSSDVIGDFLQVAEMTEDHLTTQFSDIGLNAVRYEVLQFINASAPQGCSQSQLAAEISQSESSVSTLIERMRQDNLILRLKSNTDRRKRVLMLTEEGQQLLQVAQVSYRQRMDDLVNHLSIQQQQSFLDALVVLEEEIQSSLTEETMPATTLPINPIRSAA